MKDLQKPKIYSVSELNSNIKAELESSFYNIWVEGEVSNYYYHNSQHMYFDLKDEHSKIKVVMFYRNNKDLVFEIEDGLHILVNGYISLYEKRGEYQIIALDVKPVGKGSLILAFEQLKKKLEEKGYFREEIKKKIPLLPKKIGLVTSIGGAVIRDIISVLDRRTDNYNLVVRHVNVQGLTSSAEICEAIDDLCQYRVDVIILARGGGSIEDLWAFNTEELADKIRECNIPVISAVGHETDFTISDFVSDLRAATPSVAGEVVILNKFEFIKNLSLLSEKLKKVLTTNIRDNRKKVLSLLNRKAFLNPQSLLVKFWQRVDDLNINLKRNIGSVLLNKRVTFENFKHGISKRDVLSKISGWRLNVGNVYQSLDYGIKNYLERKGMELKTLMEVLQNRSPVSILSKGFGIIYKENEDSIIKSIDEVDVGEKIRVLIKDGSLMAKILDKVYKKN
ncbi:MAG: exodeoxyribonuclease VII large subunit [Actinomycetota bacterium]